MSEKLVMTFKSADGSTVSYTIDDPIDGLTEAMVSDFMNMLIAEDVFDIKGGLKEIKSAEVVTTIKETFL